MEGNQRQGPEPHMPFGANLAHAQNTASSVCYYQVTRVLLVFMFLCYFCHYLLVLLESTESCARCEKLNDFPRLTMNAARSLLSQDFPTPLHSLLSLSVLNKISRSLCVLFINWPNVRNTLRNRSTKTPFHF